VNLVMARVRRWFSPDLWIAPPQGGRLDVTMLAAAATLIAVGTLLVFSTTIRPAVVAAKGVDPFMFLRRHVVYLAVGVFAFWTTLVVSDRLIRAFSNVLLWIAVGGLILVQIPGIGVAEGNAVRWIGIGGFTLQPSELAKLGFALYLAVYLSRNLAVIRRFLYGLGPLMFVFGVMVVLLLKQPDLGTVVLLGLLAVIMVAVGGTRKAYLLGLVAGGVAALGIAVMVWPEKLARFVGVFFPELTRHGEGWQVYNAKITVGNGGLVGQGLGEGLHHMLGYLPASNNDFIAAVAAEELGLAGVCCLMLLYLVILIRGFAVARRARDAFTRFAAFSLTTLLILPSVIHFGVDLGLLPTKGLVCSYLSYGGTAQVMNLVALGLLQRFHLDITGEEAADAQRAAAAGAGRAS
jgi:cell division protein FtsW